jgi:pyruvate dehydrogenase E2 component (dihydrolipoamide acetyltransferase)
MAPRFVREGRLSGWRKVATATWASQSEASIYGWIDLDATRLLTWIERVRERTGARVTVTHVVGKALAMGFAECPEANAVLSLRGLLRRESVDVFFSVAADGGKTVAGAKLRGVDRLSVDAIARGLDEKVARIRGEGDTEIQRTQAIMKHLPTPVVAATLRAVSALTFDLGLDLRKLGIPTDPFGTAIVTNVGVLGLEQGFAPLMPHGRSACIVTVGKVRDRSWAVGDSVRVRPVLTLGATMDHRIVDGHHLGVIAARMRSALEDPEAHLSAASPSSSPRADVEGDRAGESTASSV